MDTFSFYCSALLALYKFRQLIDHHWNTDRKLWENEAGHLSDLFKIYLTRAKAITGIPEERRYLYELAMAMGVSYVRND